MKIKLDEEVILELTETQKKVLCNEINHGMLEEDIKRRLIYIIDHKYEQCMKRLKEEWEPKLKAAGKRTIPLDSDKLAELIFEHEEYKDRAARDLELQ